MTILRPTYQVSHSPPNEDVKLSKEGENVMKKMTAPHMGQGTLVARPTNTTRQAQVAR